MISETVGFNNVNFLENIFNLFLDETFTGSAHIIINGYTTKA